MRLLVVAATEHDITTDVGLALARHLSHNGLNVSIAAAADVEDLDEHDAVAIGAVLRRGRWPRAARHLVRELADELMERPTWLFSIGRDGASRLTDAKFSRTIRSIGVHGHRVLSPHPSTGDEAFTHAVADWAHEIATDLNTHRIWMTGGPRRGGTAAVEQRLLLPKAS